MASMRDIKRRRDSIQSTEQITKAMKLVATVKLQKSKAKAENSKPYFNLMYETISSVLCKSGNLNHKYLKAGDSPKKAVIVLTSNRGLAGGYNSNISHRRGFQIKADYSEVMNEPMYRDAADLTVELLDAFAQGQVGEIYLAYTSFKNTVSQTPKLMKLLPVELEEQQEEDRAKAQALMTYEPDAEGVLDSIVPKYMSSLIYGALLEAVASENGARMTAMDSATSNAEEMIESLSLQYNRARQGAITQELTEIVAGANAIS